MADINDDGHKAACSNARKPEGGDKGVNVSSITETIIAISICATNYHEDVGWSIGPYIMEWSWIKHFKSMTQIRYNWSNQDHLP